ncbi:MAG: hypothetical protein KDD73_06825 [Anaerolineales bacterium]|nr:hypothetical protein [Anaerolineales bacterium]MCB9128120.1 DUF1566 domain-containing protein [Ardenticatenales bacterium]MCB9171832.1 DUF1566 domain-containing protein [Ardenticatenales bacterium]
MKPLERRQIVGWVAVAISTAISCLWAFWGIIENFHEGWYYASWLLNVRLMLVQYLSPMLLFMGVTLLALVRPRLGALLHVGLALFALWFFRTDSNAATLLIISPLVGLGLLYGVGRPRPRKRALALALALPLAVLILAGAAPALRVAQRVDDGNRQAREVVGNGVTLVWAPAGPGWPPRGTDWYEAQETCDHLAADGLTVAATSQAIWRLPTVDEAVRSMALHGQNSGGVWDAARSVARYEMTPDKESPLWDLHSQVIYWWTATALDEARAYIIVYDGKVWPRTKTFGPAYLAFRCVKAPA